MTTLIDPRPAHDVLAWGRDVVDPALRAAVGTLSDAARRVAEFQFGWCDEPDSRVGNAGRPAIHPTLALLTAEAAGGDHEVALPAAVALELTHGFVQLHDDVIQAGGPRPYSPTACSVFGVGPVILAGSALQTLAFDTLAAADHSGARDGVRMLSAAVHELLDARMTGQELPSGEAVGAAERTRAASAPTGALLGCACALGALFATAGASADRAGNGRTSGAGLVVGASGRKATRATYEERP